MRRLIALSSDPALKQALQELATGDVAISIVGDLRSLTDELMQNGVTAALLDAGSLDAPVDAVVDAITSQFPDLRLLVAGQGSEQNMLATRISNQTVFRFVHKPASPQRLKLFLDAATRPVETSRSVGATSEPARGHKESLARIETAVRGKSPQTVALIGVVAIAAIAAGAWAFWPKNDTAAPPAAADAAAPAAADTAAAPEVLALIKQAQLAFGAGKYVGLDGTSAAERYREAQKLDGNNVTARNGFDRSIEYGLRSAEDALLAGKLNDAATVAETLRLIAPNNSRLAFLNAQLAREQARVNADASLRQANDARQSQIRTSLAQMTERMRRGALIDPANNNALSNFREAEAAGAGDPAVRSARESLVAALLTAADNELTARRAAGAKRLLDAAGSINSVAPGLDVLRRRIDEVTGQQVAAANAEAAAQAARAEAAAAAAAAAQTAAALPPEQNNTPAPTAPSAADSIVSENTLRRLRLVEAEYPLRALEQGVKGWVEMEFTVAKDGSVQNIIVTNADPKRTFDSAAMNALRRYRYAPVVRNGEPVSQRARIRLRFTPVDVK